MLAEPIAGSTSKRLSDTIAVAMTRLENAFHAKLTRFRNFGGTSPWTMPGWDRRSIKPEEIVAKSKQVDMSLSQGRSVAEARELSRPLELPFCGKRMVRLRSYGV